MYKCKCGREFENKQSYCAHCRYCKDNLGDRYNPEIHSAKHLDGHRSGTLGMKFPNRRKYSMEDILSNKVSYQSNKLRVRLISEGYKEHKCECCGNAEWMGKKIPLEVHHKDGNKKNNNLSNLELLCPNCHALTDTYRGKNIRYAGMLE